VDSQECLAETGKDELIWAEPQRQLDEKGSKVRKGVSQDASLISVDPGGSGPCGEAAETRRSRDGDWAKRKTGSVYGYKLHTKADNDHRLVRSLDVTSASVHDSRVDLSNLGETVYRDKGYFGVEPRGFSATMRWASRGHLLCIWVRMRNTRISGRRAPGGEGFRGLEAGVSRWLCAGDDGVTCPGPVDVLPHVL